MTIILFLVDTSSSMCQKAYVNGVQKSYLDIAKGAVETFLKYRQRTQDCLGDRYMLLTFEEPPSNVKAGWKENHATFMNELKNLQSSGLTTMGESLKNAFDLLNLNRMQSGIDTYGQGRCPFYLEPSVIIVITDGGRYSFRNGVHQEIILPLNTQIPGTKFTKEPFRWDQRLYSLVLRMSGNKIDERVEGKVPHDDSPIERMCEVTGGRSYRVRSQYVLNQCIESLVQKVQPGVVLQFEPMLPKDGIPNETLQDIVFQPMKKMIYVQKHISQKTFLIGCWPLPEPYWPDPKAVMLPPRDAHPKLKVVTPAVDEPQMVRNFPVDKYEIEASPLTLQILQKRELNKVWQVIISNGMHGFELPFGYLKAAPNFTQVHLYVLAYNYPALLPLLHDLIHKYAMSPPNDLMYKFNAYVRSIPPYYCPFLRKALININVPFPLLQFLLPENVDNYLSPNIANQLKHIKNTAKQEQENLCMKVYKQLKQPKPPYRQVETAKLNPGVPLRRDLVRHPLLRDTFAKLHSEIEPIENYTIVVPQMTRQSSAKTYRNPFDIPRRDLIEEIGRMRETFLKPSATSLVAKDSGHCLPIAEMGNYQEYLKNKDNPLREIEPTNVRQHMFGNPYKKDKHMVMVDEADLSDVAPMKSNNGSGAPGAPGAPTVKKLDGTRARKRKAGPIRRDYVFRRTSIDALPGPSAYSSAGSSAGSSVGSLSDFDDDSMSDTASISSGVSEDGDPGRLVVAFDFNEEEPTEQDFPLNGYVRNFINGGDDSSCDSEASVAVVNAGVAGGGGGGGVAGGGGGGGNGGVVAAALAGAAGIPSTVITPLMADNHVIPMMGVGVLGLPPTVSGLTIPPGMSGMSGISGMNGNTLQMSPHPVVATPVVTPNPYMSAYGTLLMAESVPMLTSVMPNSTTLLTPPTSIYTPQTQMNGYAATQPIAITPPTQLALQTQMTGLSVSAAVSPTIASSPIGFAQNDINDPSEISRILQQCHNGAAVVPAAVTSTTPTTTNDSYSPMDIKDEPESSLMPPPPLALMNHYMGGVNNFDSLKREANSNAGGASSMNHNNSNHMTAAAAPVAGTNHSGKNSISPVMPETTDVALTEEQREEARQHNLEIRAQVFRDIRRPGRNYSQLLDNLNLIKGDYDMKSHFIQMCISESLRFRRRQMVNSIQEWWEDNKQQHNHNNHQQQPQHQQLQTTTS